MKNPSREPASAPAEFDGFAENYEAVIAPFINLTGENRDYFARERIVWLAEQLRRLGVKPGSAMDYGCGTGISAPLLLEMLGLDSYVGVDISERSLEVARGQCPSPKASFSVPEGRGLGEGVDLIYVNGVLHHVPPAERAPVMSYLSHSLKAGGILAFSEYNTWNPLLRLVMKLSPMDRNAVPLSPAEGCRLVQREGFEVLSTSYLFFFPRALSWFRRFEPKLARVPLGAQYLILARKPPESRPPLPAGTQRE